MAYINEEGYVERQTHGGRKNSTSKPTTRDWWLAKYDGDHLKISTGKICIPKEHIGKRIRLKVEFLK